MEAHLASIQPTQVKKITTSCEICSGLHDTQYCMKDPKQAFVEYASLHTDEAGGKWYTFNPKQNNLGDTYNPSWRSHPNLRFEADFKQQQSEMTNKIDIVLKAITNRMVGTQPSDTVKNLKLSTYPVLSARSYPTRYPQCSTQTHGLINAITIHTEQQSASYSDGEKENKEEEGDPKNIHVNPPTPLDPSDDNSCKEEPKVGEREVELSQVVLGKPFVEISNMTHDPPEGVVRFTNRNNEVAYKMPHKIEQYDSLSNLEKEHIKSVYLRNEEDKRRGVEYVMSKILGFCKECLELGPEYLTGMDDEGEVT
uniref:MAK10-like protein n=1 Tax=Tanacetum cinerariifolium TaxID=118510 RepID=A0A6L2KSU6_TANCI|nr:MAK10-like protein [Tanacetum cinerariifolium]